LKNGDRYFQKNVILPLINVNIFSIINVQIIKNSTKFLGLANMQQHVKNYLAIL